MKKESIEKYFGQKVRAILKNGNFYTLTIDNITDEDFGGIDKYGNPVTISNESVSAMETVGEK